MSKLSFTRAHRPQTEQLTAEVLLGAKQDEDGRRRFAMLGYTGAEVSRLYGRAVFDLSGIEHKERVPILLNHDDDQIAGYADTVRLTDRGLELEGYLSSATAAGQQVAALSDEGFPWEASVGLHVSEWDEVARDEPLSINGAEMVGPLSVGRKSRLMEVSFVTAGADKQTEAVALSAQETPVEKTAAEQLAEFLAEFGPEQAGWAAQQFTAGKTVDEAKAELAAEQAAKATEEQASALATAQEQIEALKSEIETLKSLKAESRHPGVGFDAPAREEAKATRPPQTPNEAWEQCESLRAEFGDQKTAWLALCAREGFSPEEFA